MAELIGHFFVKHIGEKWDIYLVLIIIYIVLIAHYIVFL